MAINGQGEQDSQQQPDNKNEQTPLEKVTSAVQNVEETPIVKKSVGPLRAFFTKFTNDWTMNLQAGALAYNLVVAIFPILLALFLIFGLVLGSLGPHVHWQVQVRGSSSCIESLDRP